MYLFAYINIYALILEFHYFFVKSFTIINTIKKLISHQLFKIFLLCYKK